MTDASPPHRRTTRPLVGTLTSRLLLSALVSSVLAMAVGGVILSLSFRAYVRGDMDRELVSFLNSMVGVSEIGPDGIIRFSGPLFDQRFQKPYSGWYWQISEAGQPPFRSRSLWDFELTPRLDTRQFSVAYHSHAGPDGQQLRVVEQDLTLPEADRVFRFQVATDIATSEAAIRRFDGLLVIALAGIALTITVIMALQTVFGLRPVRILRARIADIRSGRADRIEGDWGTDLEPVAEEVNELIVHNQKLIGRARTHVGNLAHALKTPLSVLANEAASDTPDRPMMQQQVRSIQRHVDHHLKRARIAGGGSGPGVDTKDRLTKLIAAIARMNDDRGTAFTADLAADLFFAGEVEDFDEVAGNVIDNAGKWAQSAVRIRTQRVQRAGRDMVRLSVGDDGPGVPADQRSTLFERGQRLDEQVPGTGLGLAIVRDIVELYGGDAQVGESPLGGLEVILLLPAKPVHD